MTRPAPAAAHPLPVALAAALAGLAVYGLTTCRTVYFGDSAELAAAAAVLGVAHPPGYPLYVLLGRLAALAAPGEPALGVNLLSALAGAATAGAAAAVAALLGARPLAALAAGLLVVGSRAVWSQATVAEVYTLNALLATGVLLALAADERLPRRDLRALLLAAYLLGLGLAHHLTIGHVGLAALVLLAVRRRLPLRTALAGAALAALALSLYGVVAVRSRLDPPVDWGNPETLARLADHVTAQQYHFLVGKLRAADAARRLGEIAAALGRDLHPALVPATALGFAALRRRPAWLAAFATAIAAFVAHAAAYGIPDIEGHLLPAAVALAVVTALGLEAVAGALGRVAGRAAAFLPLAAAALPIALHVTDADRSAHRSALEFGQNLLGGLPPGAVLLAEGDNQVFVLTYFRVARRARPDVTLVDRTGNLLADFYGVRGEAGTPPAIDFERRRLEVETARLEEWFAADPERPIYSSGRTTLPDVGPFFQEPSGLLFRIRPREASASAATRADSLDPWAAVRTDAIRRDVRHGDALTREIAARYWVRRGEAAFTRGDRAAMAAAFDSALAVAPDNADLSSYVGAFHAQNDMLEAAIPLLERAVSQNPLSVRGWTNLGLALVKSGRREDGAAALRESLRIQPGQEQVAAMLRQLGSR